MFVLGYTSLGETALGFASLEMLEIFDQASESDGVSKYSRGDFYNFQTMSSIIML